MLTTVAFNSIFIPLFTPKAVDKCDRQCST